MLAKVRVWWMTGQCFNIGWPVHTHGGYKHTCTHSSAGRSWLKLRCCGTKQTNDIDLPLSREGRRPESAPQVAVDILWARKRTGRGQGEAGSSRYPAKMPSVPVS